MFSRPSLPSLLFSFLRVSSVRTNERDLHADLRAGSNRLISNRFGSRRVSFFPLLEPLATVPALLLLILFIHVPSSTDSSFSFLLFFFFFFFSIFLALLRGTPFFISIPFLLLPKSPFETMRFKGIPGIWFRWQNL